MNSSEIKKYGKHIIDSSKCEFLGVFSRDTLPNQSALSRFPCCFISNTDVYKGTGKHWVVFYFNSSKDLEFFDSLGKDYVHYQFENPRTSYSSILSITRNNHRFQSSNSSLCGQYCLFFLFMRTHGHSFHQIIDSFSLGSYSI